MCYNLHIMTEKMNAEDPAGRKTQRARNSAIYGAVVFLISALLWGVLNRQHCDVGFCESNPELDFALNAVIYCVCLIGILMFVIGLLVHLRRKPRG